MPLAGRSNGHWTQNRWKQQGTLQAAIESTDHGKWQPVEGLWPLTIVVGGTFTAAVAGLRVCNQKRRPSDDDNAWPTIEIFNEPRVITLEQPFMWIKLDVESVGGGFLSANYMAAGQGG